LKISWNALLVEVVEAVEAVEVAVAEAVGVAEALVHSPRVLVQLLTNFLAASLKTS